MSPTASWRGTTAAVTAGTLAALTAKRLVASRRAWAASERGGDVPELSALDDLPVHQTTAPVPEPATSDPHFNDGYYFAAYAPGAHLFAGVRSHPNTNVLDGYGGAVRDGEQRGVRASRALRPEPFPLAVGPLEVTVLEPMRRQRVTLAENPSGVAFDLELTAVAPPFAEAVHLQYRHGRVHNHVLRYTQVCRAQGHATIDGRRHAVDAWHAARDHSWGLRATMGPHVPARGIGPGSDADRRALRLWVPFEVDGHSGFFHTHEDAAGETLDFEGRIDRADGTSVALVGVRHALRYDPGGERLRDGELTLTDADGATWSYRFAVACDPAHPQGFGYARGWSDGGQPGVYRGAQIQESERFAVADPAVRAGPDHVPDDRRLGGTEYACTLEATDGATGMAHVEHMRYGART